MSVKQVLTADDLWAMPDVPGKQLELVDGEVIEVSGASALHGWIGGLLFSLIRQAAIERNLGLVFPDNTAYVLRRDPDLVRIPDVSFVSWARVPESGIPERFWPIPPDLAVEIVSPGDVAQDVYRKVHEYLDTGTRMVWVLWPAHRALTLYSGGGAIRDLGADDMLDAGDLLPGFEVRVGALFETPRRP